MAEKVAMAAHHSFNKVVKSATAHGHRRRTGPGRLRTKLYGGRSPKQPGMRCSSSCLTKTLRGCGPRFSPSLGRTNGSSGTSWFVRVAPMVQIIDAPVPLTVEQLPDVLQFFDTLTTDPEQVIEVTKIFPEGVPVRAVLRDPQLVAQLVEVPTIASSSYVSNRTSTFQFLVVEGEFLFFKVFFPDRVQQRCMFLLNAFLSRLWSRSLILPVEASKILAQDTVHPLLCTFQLLFVKTQMSLVKGFFEFFPKLKVRRWFRTRGRK